MNSYERVITAMKGKTPDRVPLVEFIIDPTVCSALLPGATSQTDVEIHFDFDAVCCGVTFEKTEQHADGTYTDEWGVLYKPASEAVDHPVRGPITSMKDLESYTPPDPDASGRLGRMPELVSKYKNEKAIIFHQRAAFMWSAYLNGIDNLLMNFLAEPELAEMLLDKVLEANLQTARRAIQAGADIIVLGDDYASNIGPLFSPDVFDAFILPRLQRMIDCIHEEGGLAVKHTDGNIWKIIDPIVNTGIDGLNPMEPVAGMDIGDVKEKYGGKVCLLGNIDCAHLLPHGSTEEVEEAVRECIRKAAPGGGFILTSSNSIHSSVNPENYRTMIECAKKYGLYE